MRSTSLIILLVITFGFSCKKNRHVPDDEALATGEVIINGSKYATIKVGSLIWTATNYAGAGGMSYTGSSPKPEYGRYYSFSEMQSISIPQGWRIPTEADFRNLTETLGIVFENGKVSHPELIKKLTSKSNWLNVQGNNESGFNAFPGGYSVNGSVPIDGDISEFWMADGKTFSILENADKISYRIVFYAFSNQAEDRFNLRLVKNAN